jgi:hypothetical protein
MATTFSFIPLVGLDKIVAIRNGNNDEILSQRSVPAFPDMPQDAPGRPGKMRVAFRLYQADGSTPDDSSLGIFLKCPIPFKLPEDSQNFPKWSPICSLAVLGSLTDPAQITQVQPALDSYSTPGVPVEPGVILANAQFPVQAGAYFYDICFDWSHSIAS